MKIILLREKGRSHSVRILRRTVIVGLMCLSLVTTVGGIYVFQGLTREVADEQFPPASDARKSTVVASQSKFLLNGAFSSIVP